MTEEEMRTKITELEQTNKELTENFNNANETIKAKETMINTLNSNVSELKQKNYDLFIKVSNNVEQVEKNETEEKEVSTSDIISNLIGGN